MGVRVRIPKRPSGRRHSQMLANNRAPYTILFEYKSIIFKRLYCKFQKSYDNRDNLMTPQILVTLSPSGDLIAELPGTNGSRRVIALRAGAAESALLRILRAQLVAPAPPEIGSDGAPTTRQVRHWTSHDIFADPQCPFCRAEG